MPSVFTSLATFAGLFPLISMNSTQAQFLIPMAVSPGYGVIFATGVTVFLIPINDLVLEDVERLFRRDGKKTAVEDGALAIR